MTLPCFIRSTYRVHCKNLLFKCISMLFGRPFVKRFALCYRTVVCPFLPVTLVYCGQTVGWIKMKRDMPVGLVPGHIVLDGDSASPAPKGHSSHPILDPHLLWPNGCMDEDATWYGGTPWPKGHCIRWVPSSPTEKGGRAPKFSAHV